MLRAAGCGLLPGALIALTWLPGPTACARREVPTRDVVLITLDTTRVDHLGAYGYERGTTPVLDRFAAEAVVFERAWSTASWTLPAHASLFTGQWPTNHGADYAPDGNALLAEVIDPKASSEVEVARQLRVNRLRPAAVTLAELLGERGYRTAAFVAGPWLHPEFGLLQGYAHQHAEVDRLGGSRADRLTDAVLAWLERAPEEKPLHIFVNYFDPHSPYAPPPGYDSLPGANRPVHTSHEEVFRRGALPKQEREGIVARYDGEIRFMDRHLGRLFDALRSKGRYDDALIIVTADHGEAFGEHGAMTHGFWLYEEVMRVPLLVRYAGGRGGGTRMRDIVSLVDVLPIVADELGFELPRPADGVLPGLRAIAWGESRRIGIPNPLDRDIHALIQWPWKLLTHEPGASELYDLESDADELRDRSGAAEEGLLRASMQRLREHLVPPPAGGRPRPVPEDVIEQLRGVGYVE